MITALDHFKMLEKAKDAEDHERQKWFIAAREQQRTREEKLDQAEDTVLDMLVAAVLADAAHVTEFRAKLDTHDEATVKALMRNQEQLDAIRREIDGMLVQAHVLEDGRRVFKTRAGDRVYDEHGTELAVEVIDPEQIANHRPHWEDLKNSRTEEQRLLIERDRIHEYQEKLDDARERSDSDDLTQSELDELEADLDASMPDAVARQLPDYQIQSEVEIRQDFEASTEATLTQRSLSGPTPAPTQ